MASLAMAAFVAVNLAVTATYKAAARDDAQHVAVILLQMRTQKSNASSALKDCALGDDWMSQESLFQKFDKRTIRTLIDNGLIESRTSPDLAQGMQYRYLEAGNEGWISKEKQRLVNPDCPDQKQYSNVTSVRPAERSEARNSTMPLQLIAKTPRSARRAARRARRAARRKHKATEVLQKKEHEKEEEATSASDKMKKKVKSFANKFGQRRSRKRVKASKATAKASAKAAKEAKMTGDKASRHFRRANDHRHKAEKPYKSGAVRKIVDASKKAAEDVVQKAKHGGGKSS